MSKFKVGQRVWDIKKKRFDTIEEIMYESYVLKSDIRYTVSENNLHQTADDMFEKLRFELRYNEKIIQYENFEWDFTYIIEFDITGKLVNIKDQNGDVCLSVEEHQAIHQKMVELGWL